MSMIYRGSVCDAWGNSNFDDSDQIVHHRTQQVLYFECNVYTVNRTFLKAYEDFSDERANLLFEKSAKRKVSRSSAQFLIDRIRFQRKGMFASKPFRKEVTYREIKYFFAWTERPEFFMFCVTDEKLHLKSYEIYRCDCTKDVHSVCAFVYKATSDPQFILRNEKPFDILSPSPNEIDESSSNSPNPIVPYFGSNNVVIRSKGNSNSYDHLHRNAQRSHSRDVSVLNGTHYSLFNFPIDKLSNDSFTSAESCNSGGRCTSYQTNDASSDQRLAINAYSFYESSPAPTSRPKRLSSWSSVSSDSINGTNIVSRRETSSSQRDFCAQSGVSLVSQATSPFMSIPDQNPRTVSQKIDKITSPFGYPRHQFGFSNGRDSFGLPYIDMEDFENSQKSSMLTDVPVEGFKQNCSNDFHNHNSKDRTVLYASSESFFDQPLSSDGPLYMYVTYLESDSQTGGSSSLSQASTKTGTSRTTLDKETT